MGFLLPKVAHYSDQNIIQIHVGRNHPEQLSNKDKHISNVLRKYKNLQYKTVILRDLGVCDYICGCQGFGFM